MESVTRGRVYVSRSLLKKVTRAGSVVQLSQQPCCLICRRLFCESKKKSEDKSDECFFSPIINESSIFNEIDNALGMTKHPSVEYLYVVPHVSFPLLSLLRPGWYSSSNPYGHSAIRYHSSDTGDTVMNIVGKPGRKMVNFMSPQNYLFGDPMKSKEIGSEQGGIYHRSMVGFRIENVPQNQVDLMHEYYKNVESKEDNRSATFDILGGKFGLNSLWEWLFPLKSKQQTPHSSNVLSNAYETGNCALYTSRGLQCAGILQKPSLMPKMIFVKLYLSSLNSYGWRGMSVEVDRNVSIVYYNQVKDHYQMDHENGHILEQPGKINPRGWVSPFVFSASNRHFRSLRPFSHAHVYLDRSKNQALIQKSKPWKPRFTGPVWDF